MIIKYGSFNDKEGKIVAWHEDATQVGNYILTVQTSTGRKIHAIEKRLDPDQVKELIDNVPKDSTGL